MSAPIVAVVGLRAHATSADGAHVVPVLHGVDLALEAGRCVAVVGESGGGKTTFARALLALGRMRPGVTGGRFYADGKKILDDYPEHDYPVARHHDGFLLRHWQGLYEGRVGRLRGTTVFPIAQDPRAALSPYLSVGRQVADLVDRPRRERAHRARELLTSLEFPLTAIDRYPHQLSTGMCQRVQLAMALALGARGLVADEPTSKIDAIGRRAAAAQLRSVVESGRGLALFTHALALARELAHEVVVLYRGRVVERGPAASVLGSGEHHPYTSRLTDAERGTSRPDASRVIRVEGSGCPYAPRCELAVARCREDPPELAIGAGHTVRCWKFASA